MDILDQMKLQETERVALYADEMHCESQREGSFVHACRATINNRRLAPCESNRAMLEGLLNPGEEPSPKLYIALAEQFPDRFTWESQKLSRRRKSNVLCSTRSHATITSQLVRPTFNYSSEARVWRISQEQAKSKKCSTPNKLLCSATSGYATKLRLSNCGPKHVTKLKLRRQRVSRLMRTHPSKHRKSEINTQATNLFRRTLIGRR